MQSAAYTSVIEQLLLECQQGDCNISMHDATPSSGVGTLAAVAALLHFQPYINILMPLLMAEQSPNATLLKNDEVVFVMHKTR